MTALVVVLALAAITWLMKASFIVLAAGDRPVLEPGGRLQHLAPAVLASVIAVEVVAALTADAVTGSAGLLVTVTGLAVVAVVAARTRDLAAVCLAGLGFVVVVDLLLPAVLG